jgi:YD repeat-containing protein
MGYKGHMNLDYDRTADRLAIVLRQGQATESDERRGGVILRYDADGNLLSVEVPEASRRVDELGQITFSSRGGTSQSQTVIRHQSS